MNKATRDINELDREAKFAHWEIVQAQTNLDTQPSFSPYWDSRSGQDDLQVIQELGLLPGTTEEERRRLHREAMREAQEAC